MRGRPNDTLRFSAIAVDKEGDSVAYFFAWSHSPPGEWSGWLSPGIEFYQQVVFQDTGDFFLRVKAKDGAGESDWSDTFMVSIRFWRPLSPRRPAGPDKVRTGDTVAFVSSALHPLGCSVSMQFDWGDTLGEWSEFVLPGDLVWSHRVYFVPGLYEVRCQAKDRAGFVSDWSLPETVFVVDTQELERSGKP